MTGLGLAWTQTRAARPARPARTPLLLRATAWAARTLPTWPRARTAVMQTTAFGFLDFAAWQWHHIAGYAAAGVSLLVLEALSGDDRRRR